MSSAYWSRRNSWYWVSRLLTSIFPRYFLKGFCRCFRARAERPHRPKGRALSCRNIREPRNFPCCPAPSAWTFPRPEAPLRRAASSRAGTTRRRCPRTSFLDFLVGVARLAALHGAHFRLFEPALHKGRVCAGKVVVQYGECVGGNRRRKKRRNKTAERLRQAKF